MVRQVVFAFALVDVGSRLGFNFSPALAFCCLVMIGLFRFDLMSDAEIEAATERNKELEDSARFLIGFSRFLVIGFAWGFCRIAIALWGGR